METRYMNDIGQHYTYIGWKRKGIDDVFIQNHLIKYEAHHGRVWCTYPTQPIQVSHVGYLRNRTLKKFLDNIVDQDILKNDKIIKQREA